MHFWENMCSFVSEIDAYWLTLDNPSTRDLIFIPYVVY